MVKVPKKITKENLHRNSPSAIILLVSFQLYCSHGLSIYFHSDIIKAHCLCCWSSIKMIHHQREDFFAWRHCCCSISVSLLIHQKNLFWTDAAVCADIYFTYNVVCLPSPTLFISTLQVTLSFCCHQTSSKIQHNAAELLSQTMH